MQSTQFESRGKICIDKSFLRFGLICANCCATYAFCIFGSAALNIWMSKPSLMSLFKDDFDEKNKLERVLFGAKRNT